MSPGWQSNVLQIESSVENRISFALFVFKIDKFVFVMLIFVANPEEFIFCRSNKCSKFTRTAIIIHPLY